MEDSFTETSFAEAFPKLTKWDNRRDGAGLFSKIGKEEDAGRKRT
jgi:hypothetical protein